jgi:Ran GTPase-activating protein (RanGAP) involved in mRNA processing and transport
MAQFMLAKPAESKDFNMNIVKAAASVVEAFKQIAYRAFFKNCKTEFFLDPNSKELNLKSALIEDEEAKALAEALKKSNIETLNLKDNLIGDNGVEALSKAIRDNNTLKTLDLSDNDFGDEGAFAFAEAINSSQIEKVDLKNNAISNKGVEALIESLKKNKNLKSLDLRGNYQSGEFAERIL